MTPYNTGISGIQYTTLKPFQFNDPKNKQLIKHVKNFNLDFSGHIKVKKMLKRLQK
jgi:hypothetical protein